MSNEIALQSALAALADLETARRDVLAGSDGRALRPLANLIRSAKSAVRAAAMAVAS